MKAIFMRAVCIVLELVYAPIKLFPQKQKAVFISRQSDHIPLDMSLLAERIHKLSPETEVVILAKKLNSRPVRYAFHMLRQMYHIATSKAVVLDGYCVAVSVLKHKKGTCVIQMWHALGCIKKFGYQTIDTKEGSDSTTARIMKMHANYDIVTCASDITGKYYSEAFNVEKEKIKLWGMPRVDYIKEIKSPREKLQREYPDMVGKKTILYVPTFRKKNSLHVDELVEQLNNEKYRLVIKLHPLDKKQVNSNQVLDKKYETYELMKCADYVVTDYSAVAIEACILNKPIFFYTYDLEEYEKNRGLNIDICSDFPEAVSSRASEILRKIEEDDYDFNALKRFRSKYVQTLDFDNTQKISEEIITIITGGSL